MIPKLGATALSLSLALAPVFADGPALVNVRVERNGEHYLASGSLEGALTPDLLEEVAAGLETTIQYRLQVHRRRRGLPDQAIAKHRIVCAVRRDALTRQYALTRRVDDEVEETRVTENEAEMRAFMTSLRAVPVARSADLAPGEEYYLKVKANLGLMWRFYLIPWPLDTDWVRVGLNPPGNGSGDPDS